MTVDLLRSIVREALASGESTRPWEELAVQRRADLAKERKEDDDEAEVLPVERPGPNSLGPSG